MKPAFFAQLRAALRTQEGSSPAFQVPAGNSEDAASHREAVLAAASTTRPSSSRAPPGRRRGGGMIRSALHPHGSTTRLKPRKRDFGGGLQRPAVVSRVGGTGSGGGSGKPWSMAEGIPA